MITCGRIIAALGMGLLWPGVSLWAQDDQPGATFVDRTAQLVPDGIGGGRAAWGDFDGDGWVDLATGGRVYRNNGGQSFAKVSSIGKGAEIWGDFDNDGDLDLFGTPRTLIQNDGGTTTFAGENLWTTVADGIYHMGFDIVTDTNGAIEFADMYIAGWDYYYLNEDTDQNASLDDVADWLTSLLQDDMETGSLDVEFALQEDIRLLVYDRMR